MFDRHRIGDVALAILLAVPTMAMAGPAVHKPADTEARALVQKAALAESPHAERRIDIR